MKTSCLIAAVCLLMSACSLPSVGAQADSSRVSAASLEEANSMSDTQPWRLNDASLRAGVGGLQLGDGRDTLMSVLTGSHWQKPVCNRGKTAFRGTGRLFQTEQCSLSAVGAVLLHGWQVRNVDLFLLDQQLVRIDLALAGSVTEGRATDPAELAAALTVSYGQPTLQATDKQGKGPDAPITWQSQDDLIRLYPDSRLQFIDGRLESSLPALYEFEPPAGAF